MSEDGVAEDPPADGAWLRFCDARGPEIAAWLTAERRVAAAPAGASAAGEQLVIAEAALQRAIVDFVAVEVQGTDPMPLVLELLRQAEDLLHRKA